MGFLIAAACLYATWAIWVRRWTLWPTTERLKITEQSITTSLIMQLCGLILMSPASRETLGRSLHTLTGQWNLGTWAGHCCYITAAGLIGVQVASRLDFTYDEIRALFAVYFARPMTVIVPVLLALLVKSPNADHYMPDFFRCPLDGYLMAYWVILCGYIAYILAQVTRGLIVLRQDPSHRRTATLYLVGCRLGIAVCLLRIATVGIGLDFARWFWIGDSLILITFAAASSHSWRQKLRQQQMAL